MYDEKKQQEIEEKEQKQKQWDSILGEPFFIPESMLSFKLCFQPPYESWDG